MDYLMVQGSGRDIVGNEATTAYPFVGFGVTLRSFAARWLSLAANLGGEVPLAQPTLVIPQLGEVGQMGPLNGRLSVGSEWNF